MPPESRLIRCPSCGTTNRVPRDRMEHGSRALCGRCKSPLLESTGPLTVTDETFSADVEQSPLPVLLDMWAPWCGPCRTLAPVLDDLAKEFAGRVRVAKLNVDENPRTAARFGVQSIPTLLAFKAGREVDRIVGVHPRSEIARRMQQVAA